MPDLSTDYPLAGVKVLEFGHVAAGPFATMLLADLGADVIKVEPPDGDQMRAWPPLAEDDHGTFSHNFAALNRNKRSLTADLKDPEQLRRVQDLCNAADVIVENYRPGVLDRLGLGYDQVTADHDGLVYCSVSGFGLTSPYRERGAYDVVIQGMSGMMSVTGEPDGEPVKCGVPIADFVSGLYAAYTVTAALRQVREHGRSIRIDCPMLDCLLAISALQTSEYWGTGKDPMRLGSAHPRNAPYQAYRASDRPFVLAAGNDRLWARVCAATDLDHLVHDTRFATQHSRVSNQRELADLLNDRFATKPADYWLDELARHGVPCGPVNSFAEILDDPHVHATGLVRDVLIPVAGRTPTVVFPARITGLASRLDRPAPVLGADTEEVLAEWCTR